MGGSAGTWHALNFATHAHDFVTGLRSELHSNRYLIKRKRTLDVKLEHNRIATLKYDLRDLVLWIEKKTFALIAVSPSQVSGDFGFRLKRKSILGLGEVLCNYVTARPIHLDGAAVQKKTPMTQRFDNTQIVAHE